jgi:hypothetical protein
VGFAAAATVTIIASIAFVFFRQSECFEYWRSSAAIAVDYYDRSTVFGIWSSGGRKPSSCN